MKVEKKLFLSIGSLFILVAIISFILPYYFSRNNIHESERNLLSVFGKEIKERASKDLKILNKSLEKLESEVGTSLNFFMQISKSLSSKERNADWIELAFFLEHDKYEVDYVQKVVNGDQILSFVIDPYLIDPIHRYPIWKDGPCWMVTKGGAIFIGVPYINPEMVEDLQSAGNVSLSELHSNVEDKYIMFKRDELLVFLKKYKDYESSQLNSHDLNRLHDYLLKTDTPKNTGEISQFIEKEEACDICDNISKALGNEDLIEWTRSSAMTLLDFLAKEYDKKGPYQDVLVQGIACFFSGEMYDIPKDIGLYFSEEVLFPKEDDYAIYERPSYIKNSRKDRPVLVDHKSKPVTFLGQSFALDQNTSLTMGKNLKSIVRELFLDSSEMLIVADNEKILNGYDHKGTRLPIPFLDAFEKEIFLDTDIGILEVDGQVYSFAQYHLDKVFQGIRIYIVRGINEQVLLFQDILSGFYRLLTSLSWQLFTVVIVAVFIALIVLHYISKRITRSLSDLAEAAEKIGEKGGYDALPAEVKGNDEIAILSQSFHLMVEGMKAKDKIRSVLDKVVSKKIADEILSHPIEIGGEEKECSVLFIDIRNFTKFTESVSASTVVSYINDFMGRMIHIIEKNHGVIDKFIGDEIMALFGTPILRKNHADCSIQSALEMIEELKVWNIERKENGLPVLEAGVGIHSGKMIAGNMGSKDRLNYTVLGKGVNLASRLCNAAAPMEIILSEDTYLKLENTNLVQTKEFDQISLKGVINMTKIYRIK